MMLGPTAQLLCSESLPLQGVCYSVILFLPSSNATLSSLLISLLCSCVHPISRFIWSFNYIPLGCHSVFSFLHSQITYEIHTPNTAATHLLPLHHLLVICLLCLSSETPLTNTPTTSSPPGQKPSPSSAHPLFLLWFILPDLHNRLIWFFSSCNVDISFSVALEFYFCPSLSHWNTSLRFVFSVHASLPYSTAHSLLCSPGP